MEIHKPKPWHGWREFLKEFGTIVLGVSVALAAEQGVEWWHWQSEVTAARAALREEMSPIVDFYGTRAAIATCVDMKLNLVEAMIDDVAANRQPNTRGMDFSGLGTPLYDSEWQSERSSQVLTHFPRQELALMNTFYGLFKDTHDFLLEEAAAWAHLAVLQMASQKLGPADLAQLRANYYLARRYQGLNARNAARQLEVAARLGLKPVALTPAKIAERCNRVGNLSARQ